MKEIERLCLAIYQNFSAKCTLMWKNEKILGELYEVSVAKIKKLIQCTSDFENACCIKTLDKLWQMYFSTMCQI